MSAEDSPQNKRWTHEAVNKLGVEKGFLPAEYWPESYRWEGDDIFPVETEGGRSITTSPHLIGRPGMMNDFDFTGMQQRIRETRKARNMSLDDVAKASGFTKSHVWEMEKGRSRNPTVRAIWGLSGALGVSPAWLLGLDTEQSAIDPLALEIAALIERRTKEPSHDQ